MKSMNEILMALQVEATANGVNLTYTNKMVYLKLIELAEAKAEEDYSVWVRFYATNAELVKYCNAAPRMITDSIRKLEACGVLKYKVNSPKPTAFTLVKRYFV